MARRPFVLRPLPLLSLPALLAVPALVPTAPSGLSAQDAAEVPELSARDIAAACGPRTDGSTQGALVGLVSDLESGQPLPGLVVRVDWGEPDELAPGELRVGGEAAATSERVEVLGEGLWYACGVGAGTVRAEVLLGAEVLDEQEIELEAGTVHRLDFVVEFSSPGEPSGIFGHVRDARTGEPVPGAQIQLRGAGPVTISNSRGFFAIDSVRSGLHALDVAHIAYANREIPVFLQPGSAGQVEVTLAQEAFELEGLEVTVRASRRMRGLREAERRRDLRFGTFLDAEEIEASGMMLLGDALRALPSAMSRMVGRGVQRDYRIRTIGLDGPTWCTPAVFINGRRERFGGTLETFSATQFVSIELHKGPVVPGEFVTMDGQHLCGVVSAWTKVG